MTSRSEQVSIGPIITVDSDLLPDFHGQDGRRTEASTRIAAALDAMKPGDWRTFSTDGGNPDILRHRIINIGRRKFGPGVIRTRFDKENRLWVTRTG